MTQEQGRPTVPLEVAQEVATIVAAITTGPVRDAVTEALSRRLPEIPWLAMVLDVRQRIEGREVPKRR